MIVFIVLRAVREVICEARACAASSSSATPAPATNKAPPGAGLPSPRDEHQGGPAVAIVAAAEPPALRRIGRQHAGHVAGREARTGTSRPPGRRNPRQIGRESRSGRAKMLAKTRSKRPARSASGLRTPGPA